MLRSPRKRRGAAASRRLCVSMAFGVTLSSSCAAPQPAECEAYIACFFPEGGPSPYADDPSNSQLASQRAAVIATYGEQGECWRHGKDDSLYRACHEACVGAVLEECDAGMESPGTGTCVEDSAEGPTFAPANGPSLRCADLTDG